MKAPLFLAVLAAAALAPAQAKVTHHVVGQDRGWDPSSDVAAWAATRNFLIGDSLWFTYSSALESVVELRSREEYEACDTSNPVGMYSDGLSRVALVEAGLRYFASGNPESCKKGLKIPVRVRPPGGGVLMKPLPRSETDALADAPSAPPPPSGGVALTAAPPFQPLLGLIFFTWMLL